MLDDSVHLQASREIAMNAAQRRIHQAALKVFAEKGSTEVNVSELAEAAGVARGTIYNNLESTDHLFEHVAAQLAEEMDERIAKSYAHEDDPAVRTSIGMRLYIKRTHDEPHWGRFLVHFGLTNASLRKIWVGPPMKDLTKGLQSGRFTFRPEQAPAALGIVAGATLSAVVLVLEGLRTWREAGSDAAELVLRGFGVKVKEAHAIATRELPSLVEVE